jgi:hypothetical protein
MFTNDPDVNTYIISLLDLHDVYRLCQTNTENSNYVCKNVQFLCRLSVANSKAEKIISKDRNYAVLMFEDEYITFLPIRVVLYYFNIFHDLYGSPWAMKDHELQLYDFTMQKNHDRGQQYFCYINTESGGEIAFDVSSSLLKNILTHLYYNNLLFL